jgi:hypothetical protein
MAAFHLIIYGRFWVITKDYYPKPSICSLLCVGLAVKLLRTDRMLKRVQLRGS